MIFNRNNYLSRLLSYPGMAESTLRLRKAYWLNIMVISFFVGAMTLLAYLLEVQSLVLYGLMLLSIYVTFMILLILFNFKRMWLIHLVHHLQLAVTFYIIVRLGGLDHCGGIILAGLGMVIASISFYSNQWAIWYFAFYFLGLLIVAAIQFRMQLPAEMPSHVNYLFFLINTICLSAYSLVIVLVYLKQYTQAEKEKIKRLKELDEVKNTPFQLDDQGNSTFRRNGKYVGEQSSGIFEGASGWEIMIAFTAAENDPANSPTGEGLANVLIFGWVYY